MLNQQMIAQSVIWACQKEVMSPKPGNVNGYSAGHEMEVADFIKSAAAIAPIMASVGLSVGDLVLQSVTATRQVVNCNTNLGIILLFAPLCIAIRQCASFDDLESALTDTLANLTVEDAEKCYLAIQKAEAGGMGEIDQQDIHSIPTISLREAMKIAQDRDTIARQYLNNYQEIWQVTLPTLKAQLNYGESLEWSASFAYLMLLSILPDSLIVRKQGLALASEVTKKAQQFVATIKENNRLSDKEDEIISFDQELKKKKLNPGTSADMIAATLLIYSFEQAFSSVN